MRAVSRSLSDTDLPSVRLRATGAALVRGEPQALGWLGSRAAWSKPCALLSDSENALSRVLGSVVTPSDEHA